MFKPITIALLLIIADQIFGQSNAPETTIQLKLDWNEGEKKQYKISIEKSRHNGSDTLSSEMTTYDLDITVLSKTDSSYTIEWIVGNIKTNSTNPIIQKLTPVSKPKRLLFKTTEGGVFLYLINWEEVKNHLDAFKNTVESIFQNYPEARANLSAIQELLQTKEDYQFLASEDVQQFLFFHGREYIEKDLLFEATKVPSINRQALLDADLTILLEGVNEEEGLYRFRATQKTNEEQLASYTYDYIKSLSKKMNMAPPKKKEFKDLKNEILTTSDVYKAGWVQKSTQIIEVIAGSMSNIEKRVIELK